MTLAVTKFSRHLTGCPLRRETEAAPDAGRSVAMLVGDFTEQYLADSEPDTEGVVGRVRWDPVTPTVQAAKIHSRRAADSIRRVGGHLLLGAKEQVEVSLELGGVELSGRADLVTTAGEPLEIKVGSHYRPEWLLQLAVYILATGAARGFLIQARRPCEPGEKAQVREVMHQEAEDICLVGLDKFNNSATANSKLRPGFECRNCPADHCSFHPRPEGLTA